MGRDSTAKCFSVILAEEAPIAYDVTKVVKQLKEQKMKDYDDSDEELDLIDGDNIYEEGRSQGRFEAYANAIKIVQNAAD